MIILFKMTGRKKKSAVMRAPSTTTNRAWKKYMRIHKDTQTVLRRPRQHTQGPTGRGRRTKRMSQKSFPKSRQLPYV